MSFTSLLRIHQLKRTSGATRIVCAATLMAITLTTTSASAAYVTVHGGPTYIPGDGFQGGAVAGVNDAGVAVGNVYTEESSQYITFLVVRWDSSDAPAIELGLGSATDTNEAGTAVGYAIKFVSLDPIYVAVRWDASGTAATELGMLDGNNYVDSNAVAINDTGTAVGQTSVGFQGYHAVRWDASGAATKLGHLGTDPSRHTSVFAINDSGTAVGYAGKSAGSDKGSRAVRWEVSGTAATELGNLGTDPSGLTYSSAFAINDAGTAVGFAQMFAIPGEYFGAGDRAVRWDAGGAAATELGNLGTDASGVTSSSAFAINDAGTTIGHATKYDDSGVGRGSRAVRWDASGTAATELGNLGTGIGPFDVSDFTETNVSAINDAGIAVGYADDYDDSGANLGERAVYWGLDAVAVDLNTLIDPVSGWTLNRATAISNTGWIGGSGTFDPDGAGGQEAYARLFLIQVPAPSDLPGDYSGNGTVGPEDYDVWKANYGSSNPAADGNNDHVVDAADYTIWRNNFGASLDDGLGAVSTTVPEPATFVLAAVAVLGLLALARPR